MKKEKERTRKVCKEFHNFLQDDTRIYTVADIDKILTIAKGYMAEVTDARHKVTYVSLPAAFDIETTSLYDDGEKRGIMYCWTFGIFGMVIFGRTWEEFVFLFESIAKELELSLTKRLIVYVHNLGYDFQFFRKWLKFDQVFSVDNRKPVYAVTTTGIEFRCSYLLTGYSLAKVGENCKKYPIKKMVGDLDYSKVRHSTTPMTREEVLYCVHDVKVVMSYIHELIDMHGDITKLPLTNTGFVRAYCKKSCFYGFGGRKNPTIYKKFMKRLTLEKEVYAMLKRAFQGGFTHANSLHVGYTRLRVSSQDFTSSYPAVMVAEKFPMSTFKKINTETMTQEQFENYIEAYCCLFDLHLYGVKTKANIYEHLISESRCYRIAEKITDNGRVVSAGELHTTITDVDWATVKGVYDFDGYRVSNLYIARRGYLPKDFILAVLKLYEDKTTLKDVTEKKPEYQHSKGMLNSTFGMCVTDIIQLMNEYINDEWAEPKAPDIVSELEKYNNNPGRFLYYPWGVWVTAYARRNLWTAIFELGEDYIYSDTDSVKYLNVEKHKAYFDRYNAWITQKLHKTCDDLHIDRAKICPKTVKGKEKPLGVWDFEGTYEKFKTLGAKRYLTEKDGEIELTVSGVNKKLAVPYLQKTYGEQIFEKFDDGLYIPRGVSGKKTHTYIDIETEGTITDYTGITSEYHELSSIHMEESDYSMSISPGYLAFLESVIGGFYYG